LQADRDIAEFGMTDIPVATTARAAMTAPSPDRLLFIDNIRWSMIILVLSMHASDTYSPFGNWYYVDRQPAGLGTELFFGIYQSFLQAFSWRCCSSSPAISPLPPVIEKGFRSSSETASSGLDCRPCSTCS
jgi:hypothetical protein